MTKKGHIHFKLLKKEVAVVFNKKNSGSAPIQEWKGATIVSFQEDLFEKTKGRVSEKWFYTYCKKTPEKLPRIDTLNLLSIYTGYQNWEDFLAKNKAIDRRLFSVKKWPILILSVIGLILFISFYKNENNYHFCFVDEDTNLPITNTKITLEILVNHEPSIYASTDSLGCFNYTSKKDHVTIIATSPFYIKDTIYKNHELKNNSIIKLKTDDYALMLHYYTNGNIKDWQKRKKELENLIDNKAKIYQVFRNNIGIEMYTKEDFINKLLIPTSSLKNIQVLKKEYKDRKIVTLKFMTK